MGIYMSTVTYRHENNHSYKKGGVKHTIKEKLVDGEKGVSFVFLKKVGEDDAKFYRLSVQETEKDSFQVREKKGDKESESQMNLKDLMKLVKANKELGFVVHYMEKERGTYKGKKAKKASKKSSKKASKKGSKKSKKASKKQVGGKKKSKKASKKSKKASKKASKKSKKASKKSKKASKKSMKGARDKKAKTEQKGGKKKSKKASKKSKKASKKASKKSKKGS